ncbi:TetR family transcriptional regulator [Rhizobium sp. LCM 4573]|uniref:TetR family transcriptional regulator n=1 Tax=Rhizobium sp. LCM 4573 TaxID=1848291 RepID=UPI0008D9C0A6|nr:TetR family transcriptional regulator [Rhizobium sp. LCM 4573]OHV76084.1 TetR family transcriptional regulator [Rhizobium sp. LCM 4573]
MPRPKTLPDSEVLSAALSLMHAQGPDALTFAALAAASGLSGSTLVQRFKSKAELARAALLFAWDQLDARTEEAAAAAPKTPEGAIELLVALSGDYGGIESYAEGLLILREDFRDPALRARGKAWGERLQQALSDCFAATPGAPKDIGALMAAQWQGALIWWGFDPALPVEEHVRRSLNALIVAVMRQ